MLHVQLFPIYKCDRPNALPRAPYDLHHDEMANTPFSTTEDSGRQINATSTNTSVETSNSERFDIEDEVEKEGPTDQRSDISKGPS